MAINPTGIYKITSPSGKVYIGQSWNIHRRFIDYRNLHCKVQTHLYRSLLKHGVDAHTFEIVHELPSDIDQDTIDRYEQLYMDCYRDAGIELLNCRGAGARGKHSNEAKEKMRFAALGNKKGCGKECTDEKKYKIGLANGKAVYQFDLTGKLLREFISQAEAERFTKVDQRNISACTRNKIKRAGGFIWRSSLN